MLRAELSNVLHQGDKGLVPYWHDMGGRALHLTELLRATDVRTVHWAHYRGIVDSFHVVGKVIGEVRLVETQNAVVEDVNKRFDVVGQSVRSSGKQEGQC